MKHAAFLLLIMLSLSPSFASDAKDIAQYSTDFADASALQPWQEHVVPGFSSKWRDPRIENNALVLEPYSAGWFEDMQGGHLYRQVDGNFIVTAQIKVKGTQAKLPQTLFSLAGLFVRAPRPGLTAENWQKQQENWLFFAMGSAYPAGSAQFEIKSTYNSLSTLKIKDASQVYSKKPRWVDLRIARQGELFTLLYRIEGKQNFTMLDQFIRPDLPTLLNVGLTAYADWESAEAIYPDFERYNTAPAAKNADLIAYVKRIDFRRPAVDRFPLATLDPAVSFMPEVSKKRYDDLIKF